jgi:hypothetical protein
MAARFFCFYRLIWGILSNSLPLGSDAVEVCLNAGL